MDLAIQALLTPEGRPCVWVGVRNPPAAPAPPALVWKIDGAVVPPPRALRALAPIRSGDLLRGGDPCAVTAGVFEIDVAPGTQRCVAVQLGSLEEACQVGALPATVPRGGEHGLSGGWFNVLVASCYHRPEAQPQAAAKVAKQVPPDRIPDLGLYLGDQVYLDLPTLQNFPSDKPGLARILEQNYADTWFEGGPGDRQGEAALFGLAPRVAIPDDHEFWNNAPHKSPIVENSLHYGPRDTWRSAALSLFGSFQIAGAVGSPITFDVPPLSFFLLDSRTFRERNHSQSTDPASREALEGWCKRIVDEKRFGIFATGQSLVGDRGRWYSRFTDPLAKRVGDFGLQDYGDYDALTGCLVQAARPERPIVCLTGDVHFGRTLWGRRRDRMDPRPSFYELISSPLALVTTVGMDQGKNAVNVVKGWFGSGDPWPRHGDPKEPPPAVQLAESPCNVTLERWRGRRGDHLALLSFRQQGSSWEPRIGLEVRYFALDGQDAGSDPELIELELGGWPRDDDPNWKDVRS